MILWKSEMKLLSRVQLSVTPWTVAYQAPPSTGFSRQEYWSGLPFPSPGESSQPRGRTRSPALQADALPSKPPGKLLLNNFRPKRKKNLNLINAFGSQEKIFGSQFLHITWKYHQEVDICSTFEKSRINEMTWCQNLLPLNPSSGSPWKRPPFS